MLMVNAEQFPQRLRIEILLKRLEEIPCGPHLRNLCPAKEGAVHDISTRNTGVAGVIDRLIFCSAVGAGGTTLWPGSVKKKLKGCATNNGSGGRTHYGHTPTRSRHTLGGGGDCAVYWGKGGEYWRIHRKFP